MDYEKKYKEALGWMRDLYPSLHGMVKEDAEYYFPELKESEDERIRKEILNYIIKGSESLYDVQQYGKERFEKWIAWVEKQGEHANFCSKIQVGDKVTRNEDGVLVNLSQLNRVAKKQGEQKPTWKPSEEQMNALNYVVNLMASSERPTENDLYYNILKSLRQQLKKLKE